MRLYRQASNQPAVSSRSMARSEPSVQGYPDTFPVVSETLRGGVSWQLWKRFSLGCKPNNSSVHSGLIREERKNVGNVPQGKGELRYGKKEGPEADLSFASTPY